MENKSTKDDKVKNYKEKHCSLVPIIIVIILFVFLLGILDLNIVLSCEWVLQLKSNLDFIGKFIEKYPWLIVVVVLIFIIYKLNKNFTINASTVNLMGCDLQFRNSEDSVKAQVKNHLSTKRALFKFSSELDNYYDVINSFHKTYEFCREQLLRFETFDETDSECYKKIEDIMSALGEFLTKYHSDYRRYYEHEIEKCDCDFEPFYVIQERYILYDAMTEDLKLLNIKMGDCAKYFNVNIEKWCFVNQAGAKSENAKQMALSRK